MTARGALRDVKMLLEPIEKDQKSWIAKPPTWNEKEVVLVIFHSELLIS
jgi:hypothetical protein